MMLPESNSGVGVDVPSRLRLGVALLVFHVLAGSSLTHAFCPDVCWCSQDGQDAACHAAAAGLGTLPSNLPADLRTLSLRYNQLTAKDLSRQLRNFPSLSKIDLSDNAVADIPAGLFSALPNLRTLNLTSNQLTQLHPGAFSQLSYLEQLDLSNNQLQRIDHHIGYHIIHLTFLNLSSNNIHDIENSTFQHFQDLRVLDLSFNQLTLLVPNAFTGMEKLEELYLQWNNLVNSFDIMGDWSQSLPSILHIDISHNRIGTQDISSTNQSLANFEVLQYLDISYNDLTSLEPGMFLTFSELRVLNLGKNPLENLTDSVFEDVPKLEVLYLDNCTSLHYIPQKLFEPLTSLRYLNLSNNPHLSYLPTSVFGALRLLSVLDISHNHLTSLPHVTFLQNQHLQQLYVEANPLTCDCSIAWVKQLMDANRTIENADSLTCTYLTNSSHIRLSDISEGDLACEPPVLLSNDTDVYQPIGSSAFLSCDVYSTPASVITWVTPRQRRLVYHNHHPQAVGHLPSRQDVQPGAWFHVNHPWHNSSSYFPSTDESERIVLLEDGTLFIDYVQRHDGGPYQCIIDHPQGNLTRVIRLHLDQGVLWSIKLMSIVIGFSSAASFFMIAMAIWAIKVAANRCINQRKRQAIKNIIDNLDAYKTQQIGRIKEIGASQMGKFRDTYHFQLERLRENYNQQMFRIRENCAQQMDKIRDNYATHVGRIKDYSSNRLERLRDNYNTQIIRIREYGSVQLERLRENYKLQQQHLIKILETMNFDNCKTVIETDCVRAESMLFDSEVLMEPIGDIPYLLETDPPSSARDSGSELDYVTASSNSDTVSNTLETCNSLKDEETDTFKPNAMQLLPGLVIQMPPEFSPDHPEDLPSDLILPPAPILELPSFREVMRSAADSDSQSETESSRQERHRKAHRKRRKSKRHNKPEETVVVVESEKLLSGDNKRNAGRLQQSETQDQGSVAGQSTDPLLTVSLPDTDESARSVLQICDPSNDSHPLSTNYGPDRESIV